MRRMLAGVILAVLSGAAGAGAQSIDDVGVDVPATAPAAHIDTNAAPVLERLQKLNLELSDRETSALTTFHARVQLTTADPKTGKSSTRVIFFARREGEVAAMLWDAATKSPLIYLRPKLAVAPHPLEDGKLGVIRSESGPFFTLGAVKGKMNGGLLWATEKNGRWWKLHIGEILESSLAAAERVSFDPSSGILKIHLHGGAVALVVDLDPRAAFVIRRATITTQDGPQLDVVLDDSTLGVDLFGVTEEKLKELKLPQSPASIAAFLTTFANWYSKPGKLGEGQEKVSRALGTLLPVDEKMQAAIDDTMHGAAKRQEDGAK